MRNLLYIIVGILFGIIMVKSEAVSWFRIQEMFRFQSFHMYGIICSAIVVGVISMQLIKRFNTRSIDNTPISPKAHLGLYRSRIIGGLLFGLGWALTGACPGPLFVNLGAGYTVMIAAIGAAVLGALVHGLLRKKLPL
ncbi:MAG: YeeE/YedE family protein [Flavobacteriales bacterium]|nr:YeeE/YedE family protein [Flavobacteriales bacterium]